MWCELVLLVYLALVCFSVVGVIGVICLMTGEGNGNPLQSSCLENPMDRGAWRAAVHGVISSQTSVAWQ